MKLSPQGKLMARLCLKIQSSQVEKMLQCTCIPAGVRHKITTPIQLLVCLKKRSVNFQEFLATFERCLEGLDDVQAITELLGRFHDTFPDKSKLDAEPEHRVPHYKPTEEQSHSFNKALIKIGNQLGPKDLEILIALSPTPEGRKENLTSSVKWFEELKCHGCISEDDTDLLEDLLRVLKLSIPAGLLKDYKEVRHHNSTCMCILCINCYLIYIFWVVALHNCVLLSVILQVYSDPQPVPSAPPIEHLPSFGSMVPTNTQQYNQVHVHVIHIP